MSWKSETIISVLSKISPISLRLRKSSYRLLVLTYHRILPETNNFVFDEGVISVSPEIFEEEIKFCKEYFTLINFEVLKECVENEAILPPNPLIITFDDGYRDNFECAFPILKKYNLPATIFLTVDYVSTNKIFWWDEVSFYMKRAGHEKKEEINNMLRSLKLISNRERIQRIEELKDRASIDLSNLNLDRQILNWEEINEMSDGGIEFGSHTMTHPVLSQLEDECELEYEIRKSKEILEDKLGKEVIAFSYPVGGKDAFNESIKEKIKKTGYDFAVTYIQGVNNFNNGMDKYALKRLHLDQESLERFKAKLSYPQLFK